MKRADGEPLLTAEEERHLLVVAHAGREVVARRAHQYRYVTPDAIAARDELLRRNLRLVESIAMKYAQSADRWAAFDDLRQAGCMGLLRAVDRFDPRRGHRLSTLSFWWIHKMCRDAMRGELMIRPRARERLQVVVPVSSLDERADFYEDTLATPEGDAAEQIAADEDAHEDAALLADLLSRHVTRLEAFILLHRYGIADGREHKPGEIAQRLTAHGMPTSTTRVSALEREALKKLRAAVGADKADKVVRLVRTARAAHDAPPRRAQRSA